MGNDYLYGGPDADLLMYGWSGRDYVSGGGGADRCLAVLDGDGEDTVLGGPATTRTPPMRATHGARSSDGASAWGSSRTDAPACAGNSRRTPGVSCFTWVATEGSSPCAPPRKTSARSIGPPCGGWSHTFRPTAARWGSSAIAIVVTSGLGVVNPLLIKEVFDNALFGEPDRVVRRRGVSEPAACSIRTWP